MRLGGMMAVDPVARRERERGKGLQRGEHLGLEAAHLARVRRLMIDGAPADDLTHHGIEGQPVGVIDVLVAGEPAEDGLTGKGEDAVRAVVTSARVLEVLAHQLMKAEHNVDLAIEQQAAIRSNLAAVELDPHAAIEIQPSVFGLAFGRKARHYRSPPMPPML